MPLQRQHHWSIKGEAIAPLTSITTLLRFSYPVRPYLPISVVVHVPGRDLPEPSTLAIRSALFFRMLLRYVLVRN